MCCPSGPGMVVAGVNVRGLIPTIPAHSHQLGHSLAVSAQVGQDPRRPVHVVGVGVEPPDLDGQLLAALLRWCRAGRLPLRPRVVARPGHLQQPRHPGDLEGGPLRVHHLVGLYRFWFSVTKKAAAEM
jgi:hypothetical protein